MSLAQLQPLLGTAWVLLQALYAYLLTPPRVSLFVRFAIRKRQPVLRVIVQSNQTGDYVGFLRILARIEAPNRFAWGPTAGPGITGYVGTSEDAALIAWSSTDGSESDATRGFQIAMTRLRGMKTVVFEAPVELAGGRAAGYLEGQRRPLWQAMGLQKERADPIAGEVEVNAELASLRSFRIPWAVDSARGRTPLARIAEALGASDTRWIDLVGQRFRYGDWQMFWIAEGIAMLTYVLLGHWFGFVWIPDSTQDTAAFSPIVYTPLALAILVLLVFRAVRPRWAPVAQGYTVPRAIVRRQNSSCH